MEFQELASIITISSKNKQGHMKPLAGCEIILLCIGSGMRAKRTYMATALPLK